MNEIAPDILRLLIDRYLGPVDAIRFARCCKRFYGVTDIRGKKKEIFRILNQQNLPENTVYWKKVRNLLSSEHPIIPYDEDEHSLSSYIYSCHGCPTTVIGTYNILDHVMYQEGRCPYCDVRVICRTALGIHKSVCAGRPLSCQKNMNYIGMFISLSKDLREELTVL